MHDNPFGDDPRPDNIPPTVPARGYRRFGPAAFRRTAAEEQAADAELGYGVTPGKKRKQPDHHARASAWLEAQGFWEDRSEFQTVTGYGVARKNDFGGFADRIAVSCGQTIGVQICSRASKSAHLGKIASDDALPYRPSRTYYQSSRGWLLAGNRLMLLLFDQPNGQGSKWRIEPFEVTIAILDERRANRRPKR